MNVERRGVQLLERRAVNAQVRLGTTLRALVVRTDSVRGKLSRARGTLIRAALVVSCGVTVAIVYAVTRRRRARRLRPSAHVDRRERLHHASQVERLVMNLVAMSARRLAKNGTRRAVVKPASVVDVRRRTP